MTEKYVHGYTQNEQDRLRRMNTLLNERCLSKLEISDAKHVLDLGSGLGILTRDIARSCTAKVIGLEYEVRQLEMARHLAAQSKESDLVEYVQGSVYTLSQHYAGTFDLIFTRFLLEHLADVPSALEQCFAALRPGGSIVVVDDDHANFRVQPEPEYFRSLWSSYCEVFENEGQDPYIGRHLVTHLHRSGFREINIDFVRFGAAKDQQYFELYADNLIGIVSGARNEILELPHWNSKQFEEAIAELHRWKELPDAALWYPANWAEAKRPFS